MQPHKFLACTAVNHGSTARHGSSLQGQNTPRSVHNMTMKTLPITVNIILALIVALALPSWVQGQAALENHDGVGSNYYLRSQETRQLSMGSNNDYNGTININVDMDSKAISCPPKDFKARPSLNLTTYISALWYPQRSAPVIYAMGKSYCSVVKYTADDSCTCFCGDDIPRIDVRNRGLDGSITGSLNDASLKAMVPNPNTSPAKIRVGFPQRFLTPANYWVVDAGRYEAIIDGTHDSTTAGNDIYDWAIISGGSPDRSSNGKCIAGIFRQFDTRGLWIFARDPFPPAGAVVAIAAYAASLGLDTESMITVEHEGCTYDFLDDDEV